VGIFSWLLGKKEKGIDELCGFLKMGANQLKMVTVSYREFAMKKRNGGIRAICSPDAELILVPASNQESRLSTMRIPMLAKRLL
jgi:hypothetical protein